MKLYQALRNNRPFRSFFVKSAISAVTYYVISSGIFGTFIWFNVYVLNNITDPNLTPEQSASIGGALSGIFVLPATLLYFAVTLFLFSKISPKTATYKYILLLGGISGIFQPICVFLSAPMLGASSIQSLLGMIILIVVIPISTPILLNPFIQQRSS